MPLKETSRSSDRIRPCGKREAMAFTGIDLTFYRTALRPDQAFDRYGVGDRDDAISVAVQNQCRGQVPSLAEPGRFEAEEINDRPDSRRSRSESAKAPPSEKPTTATRPGSVPGGGFARTDSSVRCQIGNFERISP